MTLNSSTRITIRSTGVLRGESDCSLPIVCHRVLQLSHRRFCCSKSPNSVIIHWRPHLLEKHHLERFMNHLLHICYTHVPTTSNVGARGLRGIVTVHIQFELCGTFHLLFLFLRGRIGDLVQSTRLTLIYDNHASSNICLRATTVFFVKMCARLFLKIRTPHISLTSAEKLG